MSSLSTLLAIGWPGEGLVGAPPAWISYVSLIVTFLFMYGVGRLARSYHERHDDHHRLR